jgi:hypothetical protein
MIRRELMDTGSPPLWSDQQIHDDLQAAFAAYAQVFPGPITATSTSTANQTTIALASVPEEIYGVELAGWTVPRVPDAAILHEPALRDRPSQTIVPPINPEGGTAPHRQAWAYFGQAINFRYPIAAGQALVVRYAGTQTLPADDVTALTIPDADIELPVLYACDRLVRSAHTDAVKRGAPGQWAEARDDGGYRQRYAAALAIRRGGVRSGELQALI